MVSEQPTRKVVRQFKDAGWTPGNTVGSHTKWHCPAGTHTFSLVDGHRTISPGVYSKAMKALDGDTCTEPEPEIKKEAKK